MEIKGFVLMHGGLPKGENFILLYKAFMVIQVSILFEAIHKGQRYA